MNFWQFCDVHFVGLFILIILITPWSWTATMRDKK